MVEITSLQTEQRDPTTSDLGDYSTRELLALMNKRDVSVLHAVQDCLDSIATAVDRVYPRIAKGGRLVYIGAGSSGRMGILDAAEIPPTFSAPPEQFVGLIAGGDAAIRIPQEGAEDNPQQAVDDLKKIKLASEDSLIGIAASGRTPYVIGGLEYAKSIGCLTIGVVCVSPALMKPHIIISAVTGPEVVTGSTRLKAGTATKVILNMLSTSVMIKCGKTFGNLMVDLRPTNEKLRSRAKNIFRAVCPPEQTLKYEDDSELDKLFKRCGGNLKLSILVAHTNLPVEQADDLLKNKAGVLKQALDDYNASKSASNGNGNGNGISNGNAPSSPNSQNSRKLVVAVDGGGTKTAAVITTEDGKQYYGYSGPSNMASNSVEDVTRSVSNAVLHALKSHDEDKGLVTSGIKSLDGRFRRCWVGLAGAISCSLKLRLEVLAKLNNLFGLYEEDELVLSGDSTLLASVLDTPDSLGVNTCMTLIAGTGAGSVVFEKVKNARGFREFRIVDKLGGFGPVFGDYGAGYDVGSRAIKCTLRALDVVRLKGCNYDGGLSPLNKRVIQAFDCDYETFLSGLLDSVKGGQRVSEVASVAKEVFDLAFEHDDRESLQIISSCADEMLHYVLPFVQHKIKAEETVLILGGSVFKDTHYETIILDKLKQQGIVFKAVVKSGDTAALASRTLLNQ